MLKCEYGKGANRVKLDVVAFLRFFAQSIGISTRPSPPAKQQVERPLPSEKQTVAQKQRQRDDKAE